MIYKLVITLPALNNFIPSFVIPSSYAICLIYLTISLQYFVAAFQLSVIAQPSLAILEIFNSLAWVILASRSGQLGYILEVRSRHLSSIYLTVCKDRRMLFLTISLVPLIDRMQELRVTCLKSPSLEILKIFFWGFSDVLLFHMRA